MKDEETPQIEKELTVREKMAMHLVLLLMKIVKPMNWSHELDKELNDFRGLLTQKPKK